MRVHEGGFFFVAAAGLLKSWPCMHVGSVKYMIEVRRVNTMPV